MQSRLLCFILMLLFNGLELNNPLLSVCLQVNIDIYRVIIVFFTSRTDCVSFYLVAVVFLW